MHQLDSAEKKTNPQIASWEKTHFHKWSAKEYSFLAGMLFIGLPFEPLFREDFFLKSSFVKWVDEEWLDILGAFILC